MTNSSVPTAAPNLPCREFPCNAPDHIDGDTDAREAWADGWNACLAEVKRRMKHESTRDYFAAKALPVVWSDIPDDVNRDVALASLGCLAYEMADAMLKARG